MVGNWETVLRYMGFAQIICLTVQNLMSACKIILSQHYRVSWFSGPVVLWQSKNMLEVPSAKLGVKWWNVSHFLASNKKYHLESRWGRNFHVLICHGPLQIATFWRVAPSTFHYGVCFRKFGKVQPLLTSHFQTRNQKTLSFCRILYKVSPLLTRPL